MGIRISQLQLVEGLSPNALIAISQGGTTFSVPVSVITQGLQIKAAVITSSTGNVTLSGEQTLDGTLTSTSRVLLRLQTDPAENGIWITAAGAWTRATDANTWEEHVNAFVFVQNGTVWGKTGWASTVAAEGVIGVDPITWEQLSAAGNFLAGTGLDLTGTVFSLEESVSNSILANVTGASAVPDDLVFAANTFLARAASGALAAKPMIEQVIDLAALAFGAANTLPKVNAAGTAYEYGKITTANIDPSAAITFGQLLDISTDRLLGRDTAGTGDIEEISLNATLEFTGSASIQRAALTGDVTAAAGSNTTAIAAGVIIDTDINASAAIAHSKLANGSALSVLGRSVNSVGAMASIAGTEGQVLRIASSVLGFGTIASAGIADESITFAKWADGTNTGALVWWNGTTWIETANDTFQTDGTSISFGSNPASSGSGGVIRLSPTSHIWAKSGVTDIILIGETGGNVEIGMNNAAVSAILAQVGTGGVHRFSIAGAVEMTLSATTLDGNQNTLTDWASIALGAGSVATGALINVPHGATILNGLTAAAANATLITWGVGSNDRLTLGGSVAARVFYDVATGGDHVFNVNGNAEMILSATTLDGNQNSLSDWASIALGTAPSTSGTIRLSQSGSVTGLSFDGLSNKLILAWGGADNRIFFGNTDVDAMRFDVATAGSYTYYINNVAELTLSATVLDLADNEIRFTNSSTGAKYNAPNNVSIIEARGTGAFDLPILSTVDDALLLGGTSSLTGVRIGTPTGVATLIQVNGATEYSFSATTLDGNQNTLTDWASIALGAGTVASGALINIPHDAAVSVMRGRSSDGLSNIDLLTWGEAANRMVVGSAAVADMRYNVATGGVHTLFVNSVAEYVFSSTGLDCNLNNITEVNLITFGATPSATGTLRFSNNAAVNFRNSEDTGDIQGITVNTSEQLVFGGSTTPQTDMVFLVPTGEVFDFRVNGVSEAQLTSATFDGQQNTLTDWASIDLGTNPSTAGAVNLTNNTWVNIRSSGGSSVNLIGMSSADRISVGSSSTSIVAIDLGVGTGGVTNVLVNGTTEFIFSATTLDGNQNSLTDWSFIELGGGTVATVGLIRTANNKVIIESKTAGGTDTQVLKFDASNFLQLGDANVAETFILASTAVKIDPGGSVEYTFTATGADFLGNSLTNVNIFSAEANDTVVLETAYLGSARRVTSLNRGAAITTTQVPTNGGDLVTYIGNCATAPTAAPVSGYVIFAQAGAFKGIGTSATITTMGPAEPHCPRCGSDFSREYVNPKYAGLPGVADDGHFAFCYVCLLTEMAEHAPGFDLSRVMIPRAA